MAETINIPKVGPVKKVYVWGAIGVVGVYVAWRWYSAGAAGGDETTYATSDVGEGLEPSGVVGAGGASGNVQWAGSTTDGTSGDVIDTNAEWTQAAVQFLANQGKDPIAVSEALGEFIDRRPLDDSEQAIARAAMAAFGQPPENRPWTVIPQVGPTTMSAPANLRAWDKTTTTQIGFQWDPVPGAVHYRIFRADLGSEPIGDSFDTKFWARGLQPGVTYRFQVAAISTLGKTGPKSSTYTAKTAQVSLAKPTGVKASSITRTSAVIRWNKVTGATYYRLYVNGVAHGAADTTTYTLRGLKPNTTQKVTVAADTTNREPGPQSSPISFKTKR
ncbi:MAG: fibronectin type III domain-containing protein [Streptomyces sp.]|nr:fibronectin type III domain-containing protein [Streptomyces sp.]